MSEPRRWIEQGAPVAVARLLAAASSEEPPPAGLARTLAALGAGVVVSAAGTAGATTAAVSAAGAAEAAKVSTLAGVLVLKAAALGAGLGAAFITLGFLAFPQASPSQPPALASAGTELPKSFLRDAAAKGNLPFEPGTEAPAPVTKSVHTRGQQPGQSRATSGHEAPTDAGDSLEAEQLREEVRAVDRASDALALGRAMAALAALDDYEARFPKRRFAPEALYLRMEALLRLGRQAQAETVAERLLASYPSSPHAERARQVRALSIP